jgi:hypothetical protein
MGVIIIWELLHIHILLLKIQWVLYHKEISSSSIMEPVRDLIKLDATQTLRDDELRYLDVWLDDPEADEESEEEDNDDEEVGDDEEVDQLLDDEGWVWFMHAWQQKFHLCIAFMMVCVS